ncbi:MAG TPA: 50S ribosomal protein L14 [archaeon]|jgi:large subunit ribosomal protein L14|nr:50S ribosomal protein L14 [archaeon]
MKAVSAKITKCLPVGARLTCADNSGAKELQIISVMGFKGRWRMKPTAGVASYITCRVFKGNEKVRHEIFKAAIIRQKKEYRRANGMWVSFEDNAAVIISEKGEPKGTLIKGPVAKETVERFPLIGKIAGTVV